MNRALTGAVGLGVAWTLQSVQSEEPRLAFEPGNKRKVPRPAAPVGVWCVWRHELRHSTLVDSADTRERILLLGSL